jgi:hypothetical protein
VLSGQVQRTVWARGAEQVREQVTPGTMLVDAPGPQWTGAGSHLSKTSIPW